MDSHRARIVTRHAETDEDLRACWPLMKELRPHLHDAQSLIERVDRMRAEGYRIVGIWRDDEVMALGGYRLQENLIYGRFLYLDDLVTRRSARGEGWGQRLLTEVTRLAAEAGCHQLVLDTGLSNTLAQRFYLRQGLSSSAVRFSRSLEPAAPR